MPRSNTSQTRKDIFSLCNTFMNNLQCEVSSLTHFKFVKHALSILLLKVNTVYFQYSDARQEKRLLCAQNCTMTSCYVMSYHVTLRHVVVYFQLAMLSALLDLFKKENRHNFSTYISFKREMTIC